MVGEIMKTLKEQYLEIQEDSMSELYSKLLSSTLGLDTVAQEQLKDIFIKEDLSKECFANTVNLCFNEDELNKYFELFVKQAALANEIKEMLEPHDIESRTEEIIQNFMEDKSEEMNKIYTDCLERMEQQ
ncbi:hypothetical protein [Vibrio phage S4-7]|nr:hypothetical protein [Vibrio phage S4-7]